MLNDDEGSDGDAQRPYDKASSSYRAPAQPRRERVTGNYENAPPGVGRQSRPLHGDAHRNVLSLLDGASGVGGHIDHGLL
ncbi:hypothetical protein TRSC58_00974 [Trypanosoma rangeli SC58]|nr:hypothetical protein TRSC58_00974 [Trypanosoma rangeli SC58]